jgi:hypothetical protein
MAARCSSQAISGRFVAAAASSRGKCEISTRASSTGAIRHLYKCPLPRRAPLLRLHYFSTKSRERPAVCWGVVSGEAAFFPGGLPLHSPGPDLVGRSATPCSYLGLQEAVVFFLRLPRFRWYAWWCCVSDLLPLRQDLLLLCRLVFFSVVRFAFAPSTTLR